MHYYVIEEVVVVKQYGLVLHQSINNVGTTNRTENHHHHHFICS